MQHWRVGRPGKRLLSIGTKADHRFCPGGCVGFIAARIPPEDRTALVRNLTRKGAFDFHEPIIDEPPDLRIAQHRCRTIPAVAPNRNSPHSVYSLLDRSAECVRRISTGDASEIWTQSERISRRANRPRTQRLTPMPAHYLTQISLRFCPCTPSLPLSPLLPFIWALLNSLAAFFHTPILCSQ